MTRHAVLSDIHGNWPAFEAVLDDMRVACPDAEVWCLGDTVMYGPDPVQCLEGLYQLKPSYVVPGNNDVATSDPTKYIAEGAFDSDSTFRSNKLAANHATMVWTQKQLQKSLGQDVLKWFKDLPPSERRVNGCVLVHASPCEPVGLNGNYLRDLADAEEALMEMRQHPGDRICFFGHTHVPTLFVETQPGRVYGNCEKRDVLSGEKNRVKLDPRFRVLCNPGSVGQPRDGDRRAGYLIYDDEAQSIEFRRVHYPWNKTVERLRASDISNLEILDSLKEKLQDFDVRKFLASRIEEAY